MCQNGTDGNCRREMDGAFH
uniref:Uncharacterized protein n=1 Tax=Anguilla anguilla TaxID=7936 RepID=A0A0E9PTW1_ANGAN